MRLFSDRRLLISSAIVASGFAASKILGLLREIIIARAFGTGGDLDAFFAATSFADLLFAVVAGGSLASVFIPVFSGYLVRDQAARAAGWRFASAVVTDVFLVVASLSALGMVFAPEIVGGILAPGFSPAQRALTAELLRLVLISTSIFGVSGTLTGILHAHQHFALPAIAPSLYNFGIIAGAMWLAPQFGILGVAYGVVAGSAAHFLVQVPALIYFRAHYTPTLGARDSGVGRLLALLGPRLVTMLVVRATWLMMTNLASRLGEGSVSALSYAYSLWQFPESLIGTAIALAVFPRLARHVAANEFAQLRATYTRTLALILGLAIPAMLALVVFARPIVALLFARGAFGAASTELVATVLQIYALAIVGESALELTARVFYAQHDARTPMFVALVAMLVRAGLMVWWSGTWGAPGLALAYAVGVAIEGGALGWLARARWDRDPMKRPAE
ncbi:MAG: murein biosynthesis integral membrane protein MurJ [Chloroflexi bacterium]|nr:murein biosynthesis integral membrane protein MurJ [Chloroflexota bacterium]